MEGPEQIDFLQAHVDALRAAIRAHRDMAWDDRCLEDDVALYSVLNEPIPDFALPPKAEMLESCKRYIAQRGCPVTTLPAGKMTIGQLERETERLTAANANLLKAIRAASSALRSYQYGNGSPELAIEVAGACDVAIQSAKGGGA